MRRTPLFALILLLFGACPHLARGQDISELITAEQPIPEDYESWSLFLVCNPQWLVPAGESNLLDLYNEFQAFGRVIGPEHVAVWFWSRPWSWGDTGEIQSAVDVVRSSAYCSTFDLPLSESPFVVVTTDYPGQGTLSSYPDTFLKPQNFYVLALNGVEAGEITELLTNLAEAVVEEEILETDPASEDFWRKWESVFERLRTGVLDVSRSIRVSINTQFFTIELQNE